MAPEWLPLLCCRKGYESLRICIGGGSDFEGPPKPRNQKQIHLAHPPPLPHAHERPERPDTLGCHFLRVASIRLLCFKMLWLCASLLVISWLLGATFYASPPLGVLCFKMLWLCASLLVISWLLGATFYASPPLEFYVLKCFGCVLLCWPFPGSWVPLSTRRLH